MPTEPIESRPPAAAPVENQQPAPRKLTPQAERALAEAAARRGERAEAESAKEGTRELNGRGGLEPTRYGDWEIKGLIADF